MTYANVLDHVNQTEKVLDATVEASYKLDQFFVTPPTVFPTYSQARSLQPRIVAAKTIRATNVTEDCVISVGTNAPDYDNILKSWIVRPVTEALEIIQIRTAIDLFLDTSPPYDIDVYVRVKDGAVADLFKFYFTFAADIQYSIVGEVIDKGKVVSNQSVFV